MGAGSSAEKMVDEHSVSQAGQDRIAAAIAASLALSQPPHASPPVSAPAVSRFKHWGDGLEAPAAGARHFYVYVLQQTA